MSGERSETDEPADFGLVEACECGQEDDLLPDEHGNLHCRSCAGIPPEDRLTLPLFGEAADA